MSDFEEFSKFCFKIMTGTKLLHVDYYVVLFHAIQKLIDQESNRMIINIPPRAGKTLLISIFLPLYAWCKNPCAQTILTGFNSDVLAECSGYIRTIMSDPDFQRVFPDVVIDNNKKSVERLGTMSAGVLHAIPTTGKMTGKGCGALVEDFAGLMAIDDVIKPDDANSPTERAKINNRFSNTLLSRLATETTPLAIIMQRLHADDLCGYLMKGGTSDVYDWLNIPGLIRHANSPMPDNRKVQEFEKYATGSKEWYQAQIDDYRYTHVKPILYDLKRPLEEFDDEGDSSFWKIRKTVATLKGLRSKDPYTFYSQYMGMPIGKGTAALNNEDISYYNELDRYSIKHTFITGDTASTTRTYSDYTVLCFWGVDKQNRLILLDAIVDKFEIPDLTPTVRGFWKMHNRFDPNYPTMMARAMHLEDKSSGLFLNQQFIKDGSVLVRPVPRDGTSNNDKFTRFLNTIPYFSAGRIVIPREILYTPKYDNEGNKEINIIPYIVTELKGQSALGSSTGHDDVADNFADAVAVAFEGEAMSYGDWN